MGAKWTVGLALVAVSACSTPPPAPAPAAEACVQEGTASWYHGSAKGRTSPNELVAAHKTLPFGTTVQVTSVDTGRTVAVRINDRGPFRAGRIIDLSASAARALGMKQDGVSQVRLQVDGADGGCPLQEARAS